MAEAILTVRHDSRKPAAYISDDGKCLYLKGLCRDGYYTRVSIENRGVHASTVRVWKTELPEDAIPIYEGDTMEVTF